ncbi:MAG: hypothetical protein ACRDJ3_06215 [Solirubrobacteraceae bacterium]
MTTASPVPAIDMSVRDTDDDVDREGSTWDPDHDITMSFGHAGSAQDVQAVRALVARYYKVAASGDGAKACSLLYWLSAEAIVEERNSGRPRSQHQTCAQVAAKAFRRHHAELAAEAPQVVTVTILRVKGKRGIARATFGATLERLVPVMLDGGAWRMGALLDQGAP